MRIGIIGLGRAGAVHLEACRTVPGMEVGAVCDPSPSARRTAAADGIASYADVEAMLDAERLDGVTVCAPPAAHAPLAIQCLERGMQILCEKPLAPATSDAAEMFAVARRHRRSLVVASKFRHVPEVMLARELMHSGELGEPVSFAVSFCSAVDMSARWNAERTQSGGGVIIDNGCHAFDIVYFLFGSVTRIHTTLLKPVQHLPVEDSATIRIWAGEGVIGTVDLSWSWATGRDTYLVVQGTRGTLEVGWHGSRLKLDGQAWRDVGRPYDKLDAHRRMQTQFRDLSVNGAEPWITPAECIRVVSVIEAAYRSLHSGSWERVIVRNGTGAHLATPMDEPSGVQLVAGSAPRNFEGGLTEITGDPPVDAVATARARSI